MHILLMILKIIGIVLLAVIGLLLLILSLVLFCPVAYRGSFTRKTEIMTGSVSVTWLFRLVWVTAFYDNGEHGFRIRLFGIPLDAVGRLLAGRRGRKARDSGKEPDSEKEGTTDCEEKSPDLGKEKGPGQAERTPDWGEEKNAGQLEGTPGSEKKEDGRRHHTEEKLLPEKKKSRIVSFFHRLADLPKRILRVLRSFFQKILDTLKKIDRFRELLSSEEFIHAFGLVRGSMGKLLRHVRPRKIRGYLKFGFDDPYYTGLCLGAVSVVYPWYRKTLRIEPDFHHKVLEADLYLRGRVFGAYALYILIKVYFDKNVKYMINRFRDKEAR